MPEKEIVKEVESLLRQACERLNAYDYEPALHLFDQAIQARSDLPQIRYGKAIALARVGRAGEAVEELKSLLAKQPDHQKARFLLDEISQLCPRVLAA
jgi:predicted Zn-dependent protease